MVMFNSYVNLPDGTVVSIFLNGDHMKFPDMMDSWNYIQYTQQLGKQCNIPKKIKQNHIKMPIQMDSRLQHQMTGWQPAITSLEAE